MASKSTNKSKAEEPELQIEKTVKERFSKFDEYKRQYAPRKLCIIDVEDKLAILRPITAKEVGTYSIMVADNENGIDTASRYLLEELWLDGDNELRDDEEYFIGAMLQLQRTMEVKKSTFYRL